MPRRDATGPMGKGTKTGWSAGHCTNTSNVEALNQMSGPGFGRGLGRGRRFGGGQGMGRRAARGGFFCQPDPQAERSQLQNQMETLQNQLSAVKQRLETLNEEPQDS